MLNGRKIATTPAFQTAKRSNTNSRGCQPTVGEAETCDPCGVEGVLSLPRGLPPTAIHVLSLRDNLRAVSRCTRVYFVLKFLSTNYFARPKVESISHASLLGSRLKSNVGQIRSMNHSVKRKTYSALIALYLLLPFSLLISGCASLNSQTESNKPWNQPTNYEIEKDWWFKYAHKPGDIYP